jgi:hypothetical protein
MPRTYSGQGTDWKAQLKNVMNKGFSTCMGTVGKTWCLIPQMAHWIDTTVITTMLTYGSRDWWLRVRYVRRTELSKLQRLACLAITEVMRGPKQLQWWSSWDFLLFMMMKETKAQAGIYRLMCNQQVKSKHTNFGHTKRKILVHRV